MMRQLGLLLCGALAVMQPVPVAAESLALSDSFRIGSAGVLCTAQSQVADPALKGMFDRGYRVVCRDAAAPVGALYALRTNPPPLPAGCAMEPADRAVLAGLPGVTVSRCNVDGLARVRYQAARGRTVFIADGLAGYASALQLGLQSLLADAPVTGTVEVAATEAGDPAALARLQAGTLAAGEALNEAYVRNNAANFAESAAFFDLLVEQSRQGAPGFTRGAEYLANQGLQLSNLGQFAEADRLFAAAAQALDVSDPLATRLLRNARAQHQLNQRQNGAALAELAQPVASGLGQNDASRLAGGFIDVPLSQRLNTDDAALRALAAGGTALTGVEREIILDAQAQYLGATARAAEADLQGAARDLAQAQARLAELRKGRVLSILWLRAAVATQMAAVAERLGKPGEADTALADAVELTAAQFPGSAALLAAQARQAALWSRSGRTAQAAAQFRAIVKVAPDTPGAGQVLRPLLAPWFAQLAAGDAAANAADLFDASQILVRPGVAQTQAVLARELSGGNDAAAGLFRQSITLSRDLVRTQGDIARLAQITAPTDVERQQLADLRVRAEALGRDQTSILAQLSAYPRYRSISASTVTLAALAGSLAAGDVYYKLVVVGQDAYALAVAPDAAAILKVAAPASELGELVRAIRDTVVVFEDGRPTTYPFDAAAARRLHRLLMGPDDGPLARLVAGSRHLIVEPDGPLLQLPFNLLIASDANLAAYAARLADDTADAFDARGLAWLGRDRIISTATSPRAFIDVRRLAGSRAGKAYLGLGQNSLPPPASAIPAGALAARSDCDWPLAEWRRPIAATELTLAARLLAGSGAEVTTGAAFSDTAMMARGDLKDYRVLHFATHGLVTAPRPECPARPALLTSFGTAGNGASDSDGLLSFREIFDLSLDADTIILSACDTAGAASAAATREAGITTGGNVALDGLVRAFVGAGARAVIASHWPVPDSYDATARLITGLFSDAGQVSVGEALRRSQVAMMDAADTSHPYYWSGFAIIGDAAKPLLGPAQGPALGLVSAAPRGR